MMEVYAICNGRHAVVMVEDLETTAPLLQSENFRQRMGAWRHVKYNWKGAGALEMQSKLTALCQALATVGKLEGRR